MENFNNKQKIVALIFVVTLISISHFLVPTETHTYHKIHIVFRKFFFLPPVIAAAWFGLKGVIYTTFIISVIFITHTVLEWPGNYMEQANQFGELLSFWVVGLVSGYLFDKQRILMERLIKAKEEIILVIISALEMRERNTGLHSQRVRDYTLLLARRFGMPESKIMPTGLGALLHDVGKIAIPDHILLKPSVFSEDDWKEMQRHPEEGYKLLQRVDSLGKVAEIVYAHHEHFDGTGYPRRLKGEEIPLGARLFMVADVFDALTSNRPYNSAVPYEKAAKIIRQKSGSHFDPAIVNVFFKINPLEWETIRKNYS